LLFFPVSSILEATAFHNGGSFVANSVSLTGLAFFIPSPIRANIGHSINGLEETTKARYVNEGQLSTI